MSNPIAWEAENSMSERESLETLYQRYRLPVQGFLYQLCGSFDQAEELTQETFFRAHIGLASFRGDCSTATWLFTIARNAYLKSVRHPQAEAIEPDLLEAIPEQTGAVDPVRAYTAHEQRAMINQALTQLPEKQRTILILRDIEGLAYMEIAGVLNMSLASVKVNLFRARHAFRLVYEALAAPSGGSDGTTRHK